MVGHVHVSVAIMYQQSLLVSNLHVINVSWYHNSILEVTTHLISSEVIRSSPFCCIISAIRTMLYLQTSHLISSHIITNFDIQQ